MSTRRIGLYLGVQTSAGGMFQYAQSILYAVSKLNSDKYNVTVVYLDDNWKVIISNFGLNNSRRPS